MNCVEEIIFEVEDRSFQIIQKEENKEKTLKKTVESLHELQDKRNSRAFLESQKRGRKAQKAYLKK